MTRLEREAMIRHEAYITQSVKTLFPDITKGRTRTGVCVGCGIDFIVNTKGGPNQKWCTSRCRINMQKKTTRIQGKKP